MWQTIGGILIAILVLLAMITIHELGHFTAGRLLKFKINEFAIGMGPKLLSKKGKDGTVYSFRAFPLGGFCAFEGEDGKDTPAHGVDDELVMPRSGNFVEQKPWKRLIVLAMGALFNIFSGLIFSFIMLLAVGNIYKTTLEIGEVFTKETEKEFVFIAPEGSERPDDNPNGDKIFAGDVVLKINGAAIHKYEELSAALGEVERDETGRPLPFSMTVMRQGREVTVEDLRIFTYYQPQTEARIFNCSGRGGETTNRETVGAGIAFSYKHDYTVWTALRDTVPYTLKMAGLILSSLGQLFTSATGLRNVGGTVTTVAMIGQMAAASFNNLLFLLPLLAVNLGIFNLLPIPALDGSRIVFCIIEWIRGKPVKRSVEAWIHAIGLFVLLGFIVVADILQIFVF
ncbi:MAG: site-2 protease family protein [Clostridiales bacterium]|jgi:regulator of sigma E protease|nr:site-2 protease family protein [Clostridiales bacterium]